MRPCPPGSAARNPAETPRRTAARRCTRPRASSSTSSTPPASTSRGWASPPGPTAAPRGGARPLRRASRTRRAARAPRARGPPWRSPSGSGAAAGPARRVRPRLRLDRRGDVRTTCSRACRRARPAAAHPRRHYDTKTDLLDHVQRAPIDARVPVIPLLLVGALAVVWAARPPSRAGPRGRGGGAAWPDPSMGCRSVRRALRRRLRPRAQPRRARRRRRLRGARPAGRAPRGGAAPGAHAGGDPAARGRGGGRAGLLGLRGAALRRAAGPPDLRDQPGGPRRPPSSWGCSGASASC